MHDRVKRSRLLRHNPQRRLALFAGGALIGAWALRASGDNDANDPAIARVRAFYDVVLGVMKQAKELGIRGRYAKLATAIQSTFDLAAMTRIAVGPDWNSFSPQMQASLIESFSRMTIATYANRFDGYAGEQFVVDPKPESRNTGKIVRTKLVQSNGEPPMLTCPISLILRVRVIRLKFDCPDLPAILPNGAQNPARARSNPSCAASKCGF